MYRSSAVLVSADCSTPPLTFSRAVESPAFKEPGSKARQVIATAMIGPVDERRRSDEAVFIIGSPKRIAARRNATQRQFRSSGFRLCNRACNHYHREVT